MNPYPCMSLIGCLAMIDIKCSSNCPCDVFKSSCLTHQCVHTFWRHQDRQQHQQQQHDVGEHRPVVGSDKACCGWGRLCHAVAQRPRSFYSLPSRGSSVWPTLTSHCLYSALCRRLPILLQIIFLSAIPLPECLTAPVPCIAVHVTPTLVHMLAGRT